MDQPAVAALDALPVAMVELAFNSLPPKNRQVLLGRLQIRMAAPRRAGRTLCQDILARLRREYRQHACTRGLRELTHTVIEDLDKHVFAQRPDPVSDPVSRWGATLVRAAVFAWCNASVGDARVLVWLADHKWLGAATGDEETARLDAVDAAARAIAEAHPGFVFGNRGERGLPEDLVADDGAPDIASAAESPVVSVDDEPAEEPGDPEAVCRDLVSALAEARPAAEHVLEAVTDGRPPRDEDLAPLTALAKAFESAAVVFRAVGMEAVPRRLEEMVEAARAHQGVRERDLVARETLRELLAITCPPQSPAAPAVDAAHAAARRLVDSPSWSDGEREESTALGALSRLVQLGSQTDAASEILALQQEVVRVLPACGMAAVMAHQLIVPQRAMTTGPTTDDRADDGTGAEPAPGSLAASDGSAVDDSEPLEVAPEQAEKDVVARTDDLPGTSAQAADVTEPAVAGVSHPHDVEASAVAEDDEAAHRSVSAAESSVVATPETDTPAKPLGEEISDTGTLGEPESKEAATERALARLVVERRFGLAHHVARAAGRSESQVAALRLAGAANLLNSGASQGARLVGDLLQRHSGLDGHDTEGGELLLLPALLRTALITGDHTAGAQLKLLVPRLPGTLGEVATAVADRALSGALMIASPLVVIADVSETEARLRELSDQCRSTLASQRLRFARASEIAKRWLSPDDGMLGTMLTAVINDDREALPDVREHAERLSKLAEVNNEIDRMDRKHRSSSGKPLQGSGRQDLVHLVERAVSLSKEWCLVVDGVRRADRSDGNRAVKEISALRQSMLARRETVLTELEQLARRSGAVAAAAAWAARASMEELFALLSGDAGSGRSGTGTDPERVLDVELLKICDTGAEEPGLDRLLTAVDRGWVEAVAERLAGDAFTAVRTVADLAGLGLLPGADAREFEPPLPAAIEEREDNRRADLGKTYEELIAELHRAQADGAVTDDQDLRLQELLADARKRLDDVDDHDLFEMRGALDTVRADLPAFRQEAANRIRARLNALEVTGEQRDQVLRHLDTGGLATAADLVYFLEIGEDVPEIEAGESHLTDFFPVVPDGLPNGIDRDLVGLVRAGGKHPTVSVLDYGSLSSDEAALAADALNEWRELGSLDPKDRPNISPRRQILPALKLLGYDAKSAKPWDGSLARPREYRFFEVTEVEVNGRAKVPAFGSQIKERGNTLRVLMVWGRPPAKVVMSWASHASDTSLLVLYAGTLSREARAELVSASAQLQPLLVVDDAALAYLAARGNRQVSSSTQTLLPFSGVNPYIREKRGRIGGEMFYGRDAERKSIIEPQGTQVIFGGRGLGKSALLSDAGEFFMEQRRGYHQSIYVNLDQENIGKGSSLGPEALWSVLDRELTKAQVMGRPQGRKSQKDISDHVRAAIQEWLDEDSRRRLLILLDECDQFFEADAPRFDQTKKLKGLGSDTTDRAKVVFAGLHSVQRFSKLASNGPFGHLAQTPKVIGPLAPQFAADLLVEPMRALGFEFADVDLVNRVLGYCSYQPFLLQMFGHRLVELMHRKRARRAVEGPPYTVSGSDIEAVEGDTLLRAAISAAFKDTLNLDHRYDVIANVLAYHARHHGLEVRLSDAELREECETFWRKGFEQLDTEGFRAYLSEMVGLGVLAPNHDGQGWHLRGPNALRMIGTSHEVDSRLLRAEQDCRLQESIVQEGRPELSDGRAAPLTITQLDDLLGERANQTRVVLGTQATGVAHVGDTMRTVAGRIADWKLPPIGRLSVYKQELTGGRPRERRVVISDFVDCDARPETCREAVDLAESLLPETPGVTRAVVLVTDASQMGLWRPLLMGTERSSAVPVVLRRHDRRSLQGWAQRVQKFHTDDLLDRLYALTSGWPLLVDRATEEHHQLGGPEDALRRLAKLVTDRAEARAFAHATGVYSDPLLATGYRALMATFGDDLFDMDDAVTAVECEIDDEEEARWIATCLDALQVFDRDGTQFQLEPLLRQCVSLDV
ncbi:hypothetical protein ACWEVM_06315 [Streptomyces bauhiniae]|uniref:hypothetical protein n=1 Tax=Streptomyces bauhiniae TaxID=2340725 RepID=UPI0036C580DD